MSVNEFLGLLVALLFVILWVLTALDYFRRGGVIRRDIALMFASFGVPLGFAGFVAAFDIVVPGSQLIGALALAAEPFLLLRIARHLQPVSSRIMRVAVVAMLATWITFVLSLIFVPALTGIATLSIVIYFIAVNIYTMRTFVRGVGLTSGVARHRVRLAAWGSGLLALTIILAMVPLVIPSLTEVMSGIAITVLGGAALAYYLGFTPPRWLRGMWQLHELRSFLLLMTAKPMYERLSISTSVDELCHSAVRAIGGMTSAVICQQADRREIAAHAGLNTETLMSALNPPNGIVERCFLTAAPLSVCSIDQMSSSDRALLALMGAETMHACPITTTDGVWGVSLTFHRSGALFPEDDLALLNLLTQQSAVFLENSILVDELRIHSVQMETRVDERTRELRESREQYRRIVETAQEGIWLTDAEFKTTFVNKKMADMLATTVEDMLISPPESFLDKEWLGIVDQLKSRRSAGVGEQYESKLRRRDGGALWVLTSATPLLDDSGKVIGSLTMLADITKLKNAEERLLHLNAELEERVASRTADLITVNREMEAFAYSVSHDLRAPLRGIDGFSQALLEDHADQLDDEGRHLLGRVRTAAQRMATLIDDLLNLSRISRSDMHWEDVDLSELVHTIVDDLRQTDPLRKVEIRIGPDMCVRGDKHLVRIALENLLRNAWKFTRKKEKARIEIVAVPEYGRDVYLVRDNGAGFDMAYADKLFGAFQRLHSVSEYEGTGIGLATVQRIIHRHGGRIWAEGAVNEGAAFYFTFQAPQSERSAAPDDYNTTH